MARDCGARDRPVTGSMMGLAVGSTLLTAAASRAIPSGCRSRPRDRVAFARAGLRIQRAVARYHSWRGAGHGRAARSRARAHARLRGPPDLRRVPRAAAACRRGDLLLCRPPCHRGALRALGGMRHRSVRPRLGRQGVADRAQPRRRQRAAAGGARRAARRAARTGCRVTGLRPEATGLVVEHLDRRARRVRARHVIVAVQAPFAAPLVAPRGRAAAAALAQLTLRHVPQRGRRDRRDGRDAVGRRLRDGDARPRLRHVHQPGPGAARRCDRPARRQPDAVRRRPARAAALAQSPTTSIAERFLADLHGLYPADARHDRRRRGAPLGARQRLRAARAGTASRRRSRARSGPHGNLHLAGDYFAELGNMEAAARTGPRPPSASTPDSRPTSPRSAADRVEHA